MLRGSGFDCRLIWVAATGEGWVDSELPRCREAPASHNFSCTQDLVEGPGSLASQLNRGQWALLRAGEVFGSSWGGWFSRSGGAGLMSMSYGFAWISGTIVHKAGRLRVHPLIWSAEFWSPWTSGEAWIPEMACRMQGVYQAFQQKTWSGG